MLGYVHNKTAHKLDLSANLGFASIAGHLCR